MVERDNEGKLDRLEEMVWRLIQIHETALVEAQERDDAKKIRSHAGSLAILSGIALKIVYARMKLGQPPKDELLEMLANIPEREPRRVIRVETKRGMKILSRRNAYEFR